ncbi:MAG TPA: zinc-ribbon domain-containing protein [Polyangiaceae bacterium]|nr:zinc-ribbon domain-containing protein [Polyangiaceae bacterium]
MKITCDSCGAKYTIADDKVRGRKVKIRCKGCSAPIVVDGQQPEGGMRIEGGSTDASGTPSVSSVPPGGAWSVNLSETDQQTLTTEQIVQGWAGGQVTADAFVWRQGMADWLPILECAELAPLLNGTAAAPAAALAPAPAKSDSLVPAGGRAAVSARVVGGRAQNTMDLFAGVDKAGADGVHDESEDVVMPGAGPALPNRPQTAEEARPTGARNENSVLFSLDALKAGVTTGGKPEPQKPSRAPQRGVVAEDPFNLSGGGVAALHGGPMFSLADNQALLTAPPPPEPPKVVQSFATGAPTPQAKSSSKGGLVIGAIVLLLAGAGGAVLLMGGKKEVAENKTTSSEIQKKDESAAASETKEEPKKEEAKAEEPKATESEKKPEETASKEEKPADGKAAETKPEEGTKAVASTKAGTSGSTASTKPKKEEPKEEAKPAGGDQPFSKSAAIASLGAAANQAGSCKKLGGPTGSGKVTVTFASSGKVTSANVSGPPFAGTSVGGCVASIFRKAHVPPFSGSSVTVSKGFTIN